VVSGNEKADITEAVVYACGQVLSQLCLRENMVPVPLVRMTNRLTLRENRFAVIEKPGFEVRQQAKEGARSRRTGLVLFGLNVQGRIQQII
jgi:hypothetical protein